MLRKLIITFLLALALIIPSVVLAASSATQKHYKLGGLHRLEVTWIAHTDGSFTSWETRNINGMVFGVTTDPGATAPETLYDITLTDQYGIDIMGGSLADRSATATEFIQPYNSTQGGYISMPNHGPLTVAISNIVTNSGTGKIIIWYFGR